VKSFVITVVGPNFEDVEEIELPRLPAEGQLLETKYGTAIVTKSEYLPGDNRHDGKVTCRLP